MIFTKYKIWFIPLTIIASILLVAIFVGAERHDPDTELHRYYLFNTTTRKYEDVLQWNIESDTIRVKMRVEDGIATYEFVDKEWARLYLDNILEVTSSYNISEQDSKSGVWKTKPISPVEWTFFDHGETLEFSRDMKGKEESLTESWVFSFALGIPPKITFKVQELKVVKANRNFDWILNLPPGYINVTVSHSSPEYDEVYINNLIIDWSDFGESNVSIRSDKINSEYILNFYPDGILGNITIDPSVVFIPYGASTAWSWLTLSILNTNNPDTTEVLDWNLFNWEFTDNVAPSTYVIGCNPFPVPANVASTYVKFYDMWGRSWQSAYFPTGLSGSHVYVEIEIPVCWISVRTSDMLHDHDSFHRWTITPIPPDSPEVEIDEDIKYPVVVDASDQVDWRIKVPPDEWIEDAGEVIVEHSDLVNRREYIVYFNVTLKDQPTQVWLRMYDSTTGKGIAWETFLVYVDAALTPTDVIRGWTNESMTVVVKDFFGNELYDSTQKPDEAPLFLWKIPLTIYSVKLFNQDPDYVHKIGLLWEGAGTPHEFYIAPGEVVEKWLYTGSYVVRWTPYHWYVAQDTRYFGLEITEANYFLINGTTISNITLDTSGLYALEQVITTWMMPGILYVATDLPHAPCGEDLGIVYLHPYTIVTAEISYNYTGTSALLWTPHPDRLGRNYTIDRDRLYFSGTYNTRVYINWTSNSTTRFNLTSLPASLDLGDGGNYTIWTNNSIDVTREVTFREYTLFNWAYQINEHKYTVSQPINNTMNLTMRRVNVLIGWPEHRSIDLTGVRLYDINNAMLLTRGEHFDATIGGVYLYFEDLSPGTIRTFTVTAWDYNTTGLWEAPVIMMAGEDRKSHGGENYYHVDGSWTNSYSVAYTGSLYISIKITGLIDPSSVIVVDAGASASLSEDSYSVLGNTIIIHGVGPVAIGSTLKYEVFYYKGDEEGKFSIFGPLIGPLSLYWLGLVLSLVGGYFGSFRVKGTERRQLYFISIITLVCGFLILGMLHYSGVV